MGVKKSNYPCIPEDNWWILRRKFKESIPTELSKFYVSNILNISPQSAWNNVIRHMRMIGLIDDRGKPTTLATRWKDDKKYKRVCTQIIKNQYPGELIELFPNPAAPATVVAKWFKDVCLCEGSTGIRCAEFYLMLLEGDPAKEEELLKDPNKPAAKKQRQKPAANKRADQGTLVDIFQQTEAPKSLSRTGGQSHQSPIIHVDFHIHISPDTTPEMVDEVFKRIAKHLKSFKKK